MKKVLVTGAYGFIGRQSLPFLQSAGYDIHTVSSIAREVAFGITPHQANLFSPGVVDELINKVKPTHLLHFAWYTKPHQYWTAGENIAWVTTSLELLQSFAKHGGERVVMAGTCAEYDWRYGWCSENITSLAPATLYGTCKKALQEIVSSYIQQHGLSSAWGRIFFLYGPHEHPTRLVPYLINNLLNKEPALCTAGTQIRDFMHVNDVASAFVALLNSDVQGPVNIASGQALPVKDLINQLAQKIGGLELVHLGARASPQHEPPFLVADTHRLEAEVRWKPKYNLDTGLDDAISWWRSYLTMASQ